MGGVCCKDGVEQQEQAPAPASAAAAAQASRTAEPEKEVSQLCVAAKEAPRLTSGTPTAASAPEASSISVDLTQVKLHEEKQPTVPGDVNEALQMSAARVNHFSTSATPAVPPAPSPAPKTSSPTLAAPLAASGSAPSSLMPGVVSRNPSQIQQQASAQPQPTLQPPTAIAQAQASEFTSLSTLAAGDEPSASAAVSSQAHSPPTAEAVAISPQLTEAGASIFTRDPSVGDGLIEPAAAGTSKVKVETTRRTTHHVGGAVADGSSSVSYSQSTASSQQPGSSAPHVGGHAAPEGQSIISGSSAVSPASERPAGATAATTPVANSLAGAESAEGSSYLTSDPSAAGSIPAAGKGVNTGFMFGAPRLKEHKATRDRKKESKRSKSHSSGSNASGAQPPAGSEGISCSKASGSDAVGGGRGAGSSDPAGTMIGSSAADPTLSSTEFFGGSTPAGPVPSATTVAASSSPSAGGSSGARGPKDYTSIGRRISKPIRKPVDSSRARSDPSSATGSGSACAGGAGAAAGGSNSTAGAGAGDVTASGSLFGPCRESLATATSSGAGVPEAVPEADVEGEGEDEEEDEGREGSSRRSSSEHLSIMSPPEGSEVENVLMLICNIFQLPVALVAAYRSANIFIRSTALKLTDDDQWRYSLAQLSMLNAYELRDLLIVPDALLDERFKNYYCVKNEPRIRFFMASPLRSSTGELLGTLCMADLAERTLELTNLLVVNNLQTMVIRQLERDMALAQERAESEAATERLQQEMMRALDHFEKCIMFVDTSKPGWEVLYTNMAWEHVTGIPREHVLGRVPPSMPMDIPGRVPRVHVVGRPLQDFFMALGGAALDWSSTAEEVASRSEFTVHRVAVRQKPDKLVSLHLRLATEQASGELEGLLPKGLPGWVKARGNEAHNYFVFVEEATQQQAGGGNSTVYEALAKHVEKVPGLELSHLLGKGGFGSVYYGTWNGLPVAVKMIDNRLTKTNTDGVSLEALMGQELSHPNIVKTIKYVMRNAINASSVSGSNSRGGTNSNARAGPPGPLHSRNREDPASPYSGGRIHSRHGSRGLLTSAPGSAGGGGGAAAAAAAGGAGGGPGGASTTHPTNGMMSYMTSAQPGLSGMTSAQMAAAADLTSASAMQHLNRMTSTMTSDATTVAGGGSYYSGPARRDGSLGAGTPQEANLAAAVAAAAAAAGPPSLSAHGACPPGTAGTSTTTNTSGHTAVGPASIPASSASTAAGPPSVASAGGVPANPSAVPSPVLSSRTLSVIATAPEHPGAPRASGPFTPYAGGGGGGNRTAVEPGSGQFKSLAAAPSITAAYQPGAPPPPPPPPAALQHMTPSQQHAAMTSRFSLAFSTITSGGDVLVPGKGRSPSSSSDAHTQPVGHHVGAGSAGSGEDMGEVWIIMEFCDRGSLQDALDRGALKLRKPGGEIGETHLPMMVATACEVASALQYLHERGIVHGDLTAWNVMLCTSQGGQEDRSGRNFVAKVADFGLSRTLDVRSKIKTRTYGTISHMPPECLISGIISKATDVFAFGVLLWQMYTGLRPWAGMNHGQIIYNVGMKNVQLLFPPGTPPAIADLSSCCTRTEPSQRPNFKEIMDKLDNIRASLGL